MAEKVGVGSSTPTEGRERGALDALDIRRANGLSDEQEEQIRAAGYDLDKILLEQGITAEALHEAMFLNEEIARTTLGTNYERIIASIENYNDTIAILRPSKIVDLGGGCGFTCFDAAKTWRDCKFVVCDRSSNPLEIGRVWAERLGLTNVSFRRLDFKTSNLEAILGSDNDLVIFEFVFNVGFECDEESDVIAQISPGMRSAARLLSGTGKVCVRFGEFSEHGVSGLVRSAYRTRLFVHSISASETGFTFVFGKEPSSNSEDAEVFCAMDDLGCEVRALDPGE